MLTHSYDAGKSEHEWRDWVAQSGKFGVLAVPGAGPAKAPILVPTHFTLVDNEILLHLHKVNDALPILESGAQVSFSIFGDYAYIPGPWRAKPGDDSANGVPTSYYSAINFVCKPTVISDPANIAQIINTQMADMQSEGGSKTVDSQQEPFGPMLAIVRGVRLEILSVEAKFKYDDHKPADHKERVTQKLLERAEGVDLGAAKQQQRRMNV